MNLQEYDKMAQPTFLISFEMSETQESYEHTIHGGHNIIMFVIHLVCFTTTTTQTCLVYYICGGDIVRGTECMIFNDVRTIEGG